MIPPSLWHRQDVSQSRIMLAKRLACADEAKPANADRHPRLSTIGPREVNIPVPDFDVGDVFLKIGRHTRALHGFERIARTVKFLTQISPTQAAFTPNLAVTTS